jgi:hypothetical protein
MSLEKKVLPEAARSLSFGSIGAAYAGIGTAIDNPARMILLQNLTDATLWFSFDGINDHFPMATNVSLILDVTANKTFDQGFFIAEGQRFYVKRLGTPTSGAVYLTSFYGVT